MTEALTKETWPQLVARTRGLCQVAYNHAMRNEPYSEFPGVDIDRVYTRLAALKRRRELKEAA